MQATSRDQNRDKCQEVEGGRDDHRVTTKMRAASSTTKAMAAAIMLLPFRNNPDEGRSE